MRTNFRSRLAAAAVVVPLLLAACGGDDDSGGAENPSTEAPTTDTEPSSTAVDPPSTDETFTIGVSNLGLSFPFPASISDGIEARADELGIDVVTVDAQADVNKQFNDVQDLINQGVDAILLIGVDAVASEALVDDIVAAGIPVIAVHQMVGDSQTRELTDVYPGLTAFVTQDEQTAGARAGEIAVQVVPDGGMVAIVEGAAGFAEVFNRAVLFEQVLADAAADFEIVARQPGQWTPEGAEAACQNMIQANPDIALFYAQSDDMAVGCSRAVSAAGSSARIVGIGGSQLGLDGIADGSIQGTVCYKPFDMGELAAETTFEVLTGAQTLDAAYITYETPAITADNTEECDAQW